MFVYTRVTLTPLCHTWGRVSMIYTILGRQHVFVYQWGRFFPGDQVVQRGVIFNLRGLVMGLHDLIYIVQLLYRWDFGVSVTFFLLHFINKTHRGTRRGRGYRGGY